MNCEVCRLPAEKPVWVRPVQGGRRKAHFFCNDACKRVGLQVLEAQGYKETHALLGWDVFIPMYERDD